MKPFLKLLAVVLVISLVSAFLSPILFKFLPFKFERIFNRLVMIGTLIAVLLFVRIRKSTFGKYGLGWQKGKSGSHFLKAFLTANVALLILVLLKVFMKQGAWAPAAVGLEVYFFKAILLFFTALLIGVIEEFFFRGFVFMNLRDRFKWNLFLSIIATNLFYSALHFVGYHKFFIGPKPDFIDGLRLVAMPFMQLQYLPVFWPEAVGLFLFGVVLNTLVIKSRSLYSAIGLHAGCVFFIKMDGLFVDLYNVQRVWFSSDKLYDGVVGWVFLTAIAVMIHRLIKE